jgi:anti-sigma factor RsiW
MRCDEARDRLVAWDDGELSPGEATQVAAHVRGCLACAGHAAALRAVTPRPRPVVPADVLARLHARVDPDVVLTAAARPAPPTSFGAGVRGFLRREAQVPMGAVLAYAAVLALAVGLAAFGWWGAPTELRVADQPEPLPSEQYEPASFTPLPAPAAPVEEPEGFR